MGTLGGVWGFSGIVGLLSYAVYLLAPRAAEALNEPLTMVQGVFLVGFSLFVLVAEGYRGFQKKFSPRTAARVKYLHDHPRWDHVLLAPLFCLGFFHARRKTRLTAILLTLGIFLLVTLVAYLPIPWQGLVDFGILLGLSYGILTLIAFTALAFSGKEFTHSPEVP